MNKAKKIIMMSVFSVLMFLTLSINVSAEDYDITVYNEHITADNLEIMGANGGKATFDPSTMTLTLDNYDGNELDIYSESLITLNIIGENKIVSTNEYNSSIDTSGDLLITGTGSLLLQDSSCGIYNFYGNLYIENITLTIKDNKFGAIEVSKTEDGQGTVVITDATINIDSTRSGIEAKENLYITNSTLNIKAKQEAFIADKEIMIMDSNITIDNTNEEEVSNCIEAFEDVKIYSSTLDIKTSGEGIVTDKTNDNEVLIHDSNVNIESDDTCIDTKNVYIDIYEKEMNLISKNGAGIIADNVTIDSGNIEIDANTNGIECNKLIMNSGILNILYNDKDITGSVEKNNDSIITSTDKSPDIENPETLDSITTYIIMSILSILSIFVSSLYLRKKYN